jgi:plastocyanin
MVAHKHIWFWILGGIAVAALLIFFALSNGIFPSLVEEGLRGGGVENPNAPGVPVGPPPPEGISYNQADAAAEKVVVTGAPTQPGQSLPVTGEQEIPKSAVKLTIARGAGFSPSSFTVRKGETVVVSITSGDDRSHTFVFDDASLSSVAVGVGPRETRVITFIAPAKAGSYVFRSNVFGATESGTMVVK